VQEQHTVVLVEGMSDQLALEALAGRRGRDLDDEGISIVAMGGATAVGRSLEKFGPTGLGHRLAGLCDVAEEGNFRRGLERIGLGSNLTRIEMEALGFYVCDADLEDELIRSLGTSSVRNIVVCRTGRSKDDDALPHQIVQLGHPTTQLLPKSGRVIEPSSLSWNPGL